MAFIAGMHSNGFNTQQIRWFADKTDKSTSLNHIEFPISNSWSITVWSTRERQKRKPKPDWIKDFGIKCEADFGIKCAVVSVCVCVCDNNDVPRFLLSLIYLFIFTAKYDLNVQKYTTSRIKNILNAMKSNVKVIEYLNRRFDKI